MNKPMFLLISCVRRGYVGKGTGQLDAHASVLHEAKGWSATGNGSTIYV
jgi:hypothetical protein